MILQDLDPDSIPHAEIPAVLGHLEACKAVLWSRLAAPVNGVSTAKPQLLTVPAVAAQLGIPAASLYDMARRGEFPIVQIGRRRRVDPQALAAWVAARGRKSG